MIKQEKSFNKFIPDPMVRRHCGSWIGLLVALKLNSLTYCSFKRNSACSIITSHMVSLFRLVRPRGKMFGSVLGNRPGFNQRLVIEQATISGF